jgi:zinc transport system substrate-binding protein
MKKSYVGIILSLILSITALAGCSTASDMKLVEGKVNVITTFYPLYDFAAKIGGEHTNVLNIVPAGVEPHDWAPKSQDITNMSKAQVFIYNGIGLEGWVPDFLHSLKQENKLLIVEASQNVDLIRHEESADDDHAHDESEFDPHAWISPKQAKVYAENIYKALIQADPANEQSYTANYEKLAARLNELDRTFAEKIASTARKEIVVSHEAFGYLSRDYGLTQMAIMGLAPDAEPTAQDLKEISRFIKEHNVKTIFFEELVSDKLAKTLANDMKIETIVLNPIEGLTEQDLQSGKDYFSVMEHNLQNLLKGLQ